MTYPELTELEELRRMVAARPRGMDRELATHLLEYQRREARPAWWWHFRRHAMTDDELAEDGEAPAGCAGRVRSPSPRSRPVDLTFDQQQHQFDEAISGEDCSDGGGGCRLGRQPERHGLRFSAVRRQA